MTSRCRSKIEAELGSHNGARAAAFEPWSVFRCYLGRVTLDGQSASLCSTAPGAPALLAETSDGFAWVESSGEVRLHATGRVDLGVELDPAVGSKAAL